MTAAAPRKRRPATEVLEHDARPRHGTLGHGTGGAATGAVL